MSDTASPVKLTERDMSLAAAAWQCLKSEPQIDYDKLAAICGFKNKGSAAASLRPVLKKLRLLVPGSPAASAASSASTTGVKRKTSAAPGETTEVESPLARKRVKNEVKLESASPVPLKVSKAIKTMDFVNEHGDPGELKLEDIFDFSEYTAGEGV